MKHCSHCRQSLPLEDFRTVRGDKPSWICRTCERAYARRRLRARLGLPEDASVGRGPNSRSPVGDDGLRQCTDCAQRLPLTSYMTWIWKEHRYYRSQCHDCHSVRREQSDSRWRAKRRVEVERAGERGCRRCHRMLSLDAFDKATDPRDGVYWYLPTCRTCTSAPEGRWCSGCKHVVPLGAFAQFYDKVMGKLRYRPRCATCWSKKNVAERSAQRAAKPKVRAPKPVREAPTYPCTNACGAMVSGAAKMCRECKIAQFDDSHARDTTKLIRQSTKRILRDYEQGLIKGLIWIAPDEVWSANAQCNKCGKPIMSQAYRCYTCATGRQRTVLRLDERAAAAA